ncbi:MAG: endonuclease/exonuclease/phosphatase family protein [bacterium]
MKILSWNIWCDNKKPELAINYIINSDADIICLQEISLEHLNYLKKLSSFNIVTAIDFYKIEKGIKIPYYLAILSKHKFINTKIFELEKEKKGKFISALSKTETIRECIYVDIKYKKVNYRIFNVHFDCATTPKSRLNQLKYTISLFDKGSKNIICGDFNSFGIFHINLAMSLAVKYKAKEIFKNEKKIFAKLFHENNLNNVFEKKMTYPKFALQLDYILLPIGTKLIEKEVIKKRYGSDHRSICAEIA